VRQKYYNLTDVTGQKNQRSKYFLGIVIPSPGSEEIEKIKSELLAQHNLKGALRSPAHITLHRPFEWRNDKEDDLLNTLAAFPNLPGFPINLTGFGFFSPRVIFVNVDHSEALFSLHSNLTSYAKKELNLHNQADDMRGFHPHVTVAFRDLKKPQFHELQPQFEKRKFNNKFVYSGFSILRLEKKWEVLRTFGNLDAE